MTVVRLHSHPFARTPETFELVGTLAEWLLERYGPTKPGNVRVYAGEPSATTELRSGDALLSGDAPLYVVLELPAGPLTPILINIAISLVLSAIARSFFTPEKPLDNRVQESPNNTLGARENRARPMERVEDIYGTVRSIPTLLMPSYDKYIEHKKVEFSYMSVGRGYYLVEDIREGDTLLSAITGSSAAVYAPFTSPNFGTPQLTIGDAITDPIMSVSRSNSVEGTVLPAANQLQLTSPNSYFLRGPGVALLIPPIPASTNDIIFQPESARNPNFAAVAEVGQTLNFDSGNVATGAAIPVGQVTAVAATKTYTTTVVGAFRGMVDGQPLNIAGGFANAANLGAKTVTAHTGESVTVAEALVDETNALDITNMTFTIRHTGPRTIAVVGAGYVELTGANFAPGAAIPYSQAGAMTATVDNGLVDWTDWITLGSTTMTEIWTNVKAMQGMYRDDGAKSETSVAYEIQYQQLDPDTLAPIGGVSTATGGLSGATSSERAETLERVLGWTGPTRVRARRTTPADYGFSGAVVDEITWVDLYAVSPVSKPHFGNKTTVHTVTHSTPGAAAVRRRQLNLLASRLLPTYDGATFSGAFNAAGEHISGTIAQTSRIVDILAAVTVDPRIGARPIVDIDMAQIWSVQEALDAWHAEVGQFNYTFDNDALSYEETVNAIADAAFCKAYRQNGQIRLALDRPQVNPVALFNHRNKRPKAETISRRFSNESEYDGVELVYADPETEAQESIRLPTDGSYTKLKKIEVTGIRSFPQAWLRANRELNRLRYERMSVESEVTTDARALLPNSKVLLVDNTRFKSYDGDVIGQDGLEVTLSTDVAFVEGEPHSIIFAQRDGTTQSILVTPGSKANRVLLAAPPAEALVTVPDPDAGIRTRFSFAADLIRPAQQWLVQRIESTEERYVKIRAINYSDQYYAADLLPIPPKAGIIS